MNTGVHATALVDPRAGLGGDVQVGPFAVIGPEVEIGARTRVGAHAVLEGRTTIGADCLVGHGAVVGAEPQDLKYRGEPTAVVIGDRTRLREYVTVHRATAARGVTRVGADCFLMSYVHIAHDCEVGDGTVIANAVQLAGHVTIGRHVTIGGLTPIHQFVRIGDYAMIGGGSRVPTDVPPYARAVGDPLRLFGVNAVGVTRAGMPAEERRALSHAFRLLFNSARSRAEVLTELAGSALPSVQALLSFLTATDRGVLSA